MKLGNNMKKEALWTPSFIFLMAIGTMTSMGFFIIAPIITKHATNLGASLTIAGLVAGILSITGLVARPFSGVIVDRMNQKYVMIAATAVMGLVSLGYSISGDITALIGFRIVHGAAFAVSLTVNTVMVSRFIPSSRIGEGIGYYGIGQIISTAVGPNIGMFVGEQYGYSLTFTVSGLLILLAAVLMLWIPYQSDPKRKRKKGIKLTDLIAVDLIPIAIIGGLFSLTNGLVSAFLILLADERGIAHMGLYFTVNAVVLILVRPFAGKLSDKVSMGVILYPALVLTILEAVLLAHASVLWIVLVAAVFKAVGQGSAQPMLMAACIKSQPPSRRGVATSTFFIGGDVGQGLGPIIGGAISGLFSYKVMFYCSALLLLLGMFYYLWYSRTGHGDGRGHGH